MRELGEEQVPLSIQEKAHIIQQIGDNILGLGPLEPFVRDPEITEIMVNGPLAVYIERGGKIHKTEAEFKSEDDLRRTIDKIGQGRSARGRRVAVRRRPFGRRISRERDHPASCRQGLGTHGS